MTPNDPGQVYLLHFADRIGNLDNPRAQAQHYIGWAKDPGERLHEHQRGQGAAITAHCARSGVDFDVVRTWAGDRTLERKLKNRKNARKLCPICTQEAAA